MNRSPIIHLVLGALVIIYAYIAGNLIRQQHSIPAVPETAILNAPSRTYDLVVKFKEKADQSAIDRLLASVNAKVLQKYDYLPGFSFESVESSESLEQVIARYMADPNVEYVEPNFRYYVDADLPNDPYFGQLWGLQNLGQEINGKPGGVAGADLNVLKAWEMTSGSEEIVVGVVDTGIEYTHPDLAANMWVNEGEIPDNGIDDDGNGVVDDVYGYNAVDNSGDPMDDNDHGTHCAGTIGAVGNNDEGVVGVNWRVKMMALKFLSADGSGTLNNAIEAIDYAIEMKKRGVNIRILSNSWGGGDYSRALHDAILEANKAGILFVAAAGNSSLDTDTHPHYPSAYDAENVLSVAALSNQDKLATFSNYGATTVDVAAPGVDVYSTVTGGGYEYFSGTSMATPHVSGVAALLLARDPSLKPKQIIERLIKTSAAVSSLKGKCVAGGRVDAYHALKN